MAAVAGEREQKQLWLARPVDRQAKINKRHLHQCSVAKVTMSTNISKLPPLRTPASSLATCNASEDSFAQRLKYEARALFLSKRSNQLSVASDMEELWILLEKSTPESGELDYNDFKRIANLLDNTKVK